MYICVLLAITPVMNTDYQLYNLIIQFEIVHYFYSYFFINLVIIVIFLFISVPT